MTDKTAIFAVFKNVCILLSFDAIDFNEDVLQLKELIETQVIYMVHSTF